MDEIGGIIFMKKKILRAKRKWSSYKKVLQEEKEKQQGMHNITYLGWISSPPKNLLETAYAVVSETHLQKHLIKIAFKTFHDADDNLLR